MNRQAQQTGQELLEQVAAAERERAAAPGESPLGEWEAVCIASPHLLRSQKSSHGHNIR